MRRTDATNAAPEAPGPRVLFASSEIAPFIKTGGLGDVSASLPPALAELGCEMRLAMPGYGTVLDELEAFHTVCRGRIDGHEVEIIATTTDEGLPLLLVCCEELFGRRGDPYSAPDGHDWHDNAERFSLFARALAWLVNSDEWDFRPEVLHLNDWQTALTAALLHEMPSRPATVFSIHNLGYQGLFDYETFLRLGLRGHLWSFEALEFYGRLSFIKGGIVFADRLTTVSPTYAEEIQSEAFGFGLDGLLRHRSDHLEGILNGIDTACWNPASDAFIPAPYDVRSLDEKPRNKIALKEELGLAAEEAPLLAMISRLAHQKGVDLLIEALPALLDRGAQLVILGSGEHELEQSLEQAALSRPERIAFVKARDERLAHLIEAGADIFLMPSRFEPCGLNQMYSMRYGTIPVVRRTGGLADTVTPALQRLASGTGFLFDEPTPRGLLDAASEAMRFYARHDAWRRLQVNAMTRDFTWRRSAERYVATYRRLLECDSDPVL